ncbi:glycerol-3-phosphate 1-O-acyltransferase PlsY [uncultured Anaerococcus sp.]|uniref:glycerol-3-phosphate 1-O-acyltransferase PlsY n=1 Tax=uncultured Anaerococcus sp. TaxID=293428 RepID=UPI0025E2337A|nr:glycerol-3-phosphate 1-O-acyltransferase PlsY [uncultured Anaerococcus sp.]
MTNLLVAIIAYILGSMPAGYFIGTLIYKKDIRTMGSGNVGTTNALRNFGKKAGLATFAFDFLKGFLACLIGKSLLGEEGMTVAMLFVVLGHMYSFLLNFKAGKGIATVFGALVFIKPIFALIMFAIFFIIVLFSRMVSLGSISVCIIAIFGSIYQYGMNSFTLTLSFIALLIVIKHRGNIKRIIKGEESKLF